MVDRCTLCDGLYFWHLNVLDIQLSFDYLIPLLKFLDLFCCFYSMNVEITDTKPHDID